MGRTHQFSALPVLTFLPFMALIPALPFSILPILFYRLIALTDFYHLPLASPFGPPVLTFYRFMAPYRFYHFTILPILPFSALVSLAVFAIRIKSWPCGLNIFAIFGALPVLPFYQFCHFIALVSLDIFTTRINFWPCRCNVFTISTPLPVLLFTIFYPILPFSALIGFTIPLSNRYSALPVLTLCHLRRPTGFTIVPILPFIALIGFPFTIRIIFRPCRS